MGLRSLSLVISRVPEFEGKAHAVYQRIRQSTVCFEAVLLNAKDHDIVQFYTNVTTVPNLLHDVALHHGIGTLDGTRVAIAEVLTLEPEAGGPDEDKSKRRNGTIMETWIRQVWSTRLDRLAIQEMYADVDATSGLSFDFIALVACAGVLAALGLLSNDVVTLISAMLLSPLASPINCISFGIVSARWDLMYRGLRNELIGSLLTFIFGLLVGGIFASVYGPSIPDGTQPGVFDYTWPYLLEEPAIISRGSPSAVIVGIGVAMASGVAMVLAVTGKDANALTGVLIAVALLPPIVNCGVCLAVAGVWRALARGKEHFDAPDRFLVYSGYSGAIFVSNFVIMVFTGVIFFRVKGIVPSASDWAISHVRCRTISGFPTEIKDVSKLNLTHPDAVVGTELGYFGREDDADPPTLPPSIRLTPRHV